MALDNRSELEQVLCDPDVLGAVFARHAYGMRRWVDLFSQRIPQTDDPYATELVAEIVAINARHTVLFRERAIAPRRRPRRVRLPTGGRADLRALAPLRGRRHARVRARLARALRRPARRLRRGRERSRRCRGARRPSRADNDAALARLREFAHCPDGPRGRRRPRALPVARARRDAAVCQPRLTRSPARRSQSSERALPRCRHAPGGSGRCRPRREPGRCVSDGLRIGYGTGSTRGRSWPTSTPTSPAGTPRSGRHRPPPARAPDLPGVP